MPVKTMKAEHNLFNVILSRKPDRIYKIDWKNFTADDITDIRDGMSPEDYIRSLRDYDREEIIL